MSIEIIVEGEDPIVADLTPLQYKEPVFTIETPYYLIEVTERGGKHIVSNAMDGYGINRRNYFKDAEVIIHSY